MIKPVKTTSFRAIPLETNHRNAHRFTPVKYGSAEEPPRGVENRNLLSHPDDLRMEAYVIRMT